MKNNIPIPWNNGTNSHPYLGDTLAYISTTSNSQTSSYHGKSVHCTQIKIKVQNRNFIQKTITHFHILIWIHGMHVFAAASPSEMMQH
jgi:hypothetical protein